MNRTADGIEYELTLKRIKNINLRVAADGAVKVSAPYGTDRSYIDNFVRSHSAFISRAREKTASKQPVPTIEASYGEVYKKLFGIFAAVYERFSEYGFGLPELRIRKMTSQWGNCRQKRGIITLNAYLYGLPKECIELVAAHELSHMVHANHSADFYAVFDKAMPDRLSREYELKKWRL